MVKDGESHTLTALIVTRCHQFQFKVWGLLQRDHILRGPGQDSEERRLWDFCKPSMPTTHYNAPTTLISYRPTHSVVHLSFLRKHEHINIQRPLSWQTRMIQYGLTLEIGCLSDNFMTLQRKLLAWKPTWGKKNGFHVSPPMLKFMSGISAR
jgi:hypothetical protein